MKLTAKDIYLLFVILVSGRSLELFNSALGLVLLFVFGILIFGKQFASADKKLYTPIIIWLVYVVLAYFSVRYINRFFWFIYVSKIVIAYLLLSYFGASITQKYIKTIYLLSVVSLFFWIWGTINRGSLFSIISLLDIGGIYGGKGIGIYYIDPGTFEGMVRMFSFCNSGFCWEPGPFGAFVSLALFFAIAQKDKIKNYKRYLIIFIATIITTQSSTGYLIALVALLFSFQFWIKNKTGRLFLYPFIIFLVSLVYENVPVLNGKITAEYDAMGHAEISMANAYHNDATLSLGRFASFSYDWMTFKQYPIFGTNGNSQLHALNQMYKNGSIASINGLGKILSTYGIVGTFFFLLLLIKSSFFWEKTFRYQGWFFFTILILVTGFSFSIIESPIIITFLFAPFFIQEHKRRKQPRAYIEKPSIE